MADYHMGSLGGNMRIFMEKEGSAMLEGLVDLHMYAAPSVYPTRYMDEIDLAKQARETGYRGIIVKDHHTINADRAQTVRKVVPGINFFGGIVLNYPVGGLNPEAVEAAIAFGAKEVWMPSMHAAHHIDIMGAPGYPHLENVGRKREIKGISILDGEGEIFPEVYEILEMIAEADIILGSGHLSVEEVFHLVKAAKGVGVKKILIQHPEERVTKWSPKQQTEIAALGALLEHNSGGLFSVARMNPDLFVEAIKAHGASSGVMASGSGNKDRPHPIEGMRIFIRLMLDRGISNEDIELMTKEKPGELLGV
jgi:hypothetical protein